MLEIKLARLHEAQQEIVDLGARFKVLVCGRRFGKTTVAVDMLCERLLDGESVAYFAPTYRMGAEVWREIKRILRPLIYSSNEKDWRMALYSGGVFECWSLANEAGEMVRGRTYHYVVMDEAALFDSAETWHGAIRPLLTDSSGGALFCSTPRGRNWFWQLYLQGLDETQSEWRSWRFPTAANPQMRAAEIEAARQGMPERFFRQEYLAEFLDDGGVVFRNVEKVCQLKPYLSHGPSPFWSGEQDEARDGDDLAGGRSRLRPYVSGGFTGACYFGVDWGKDNDFTAISVMSQDGRQLWLERFKQIGWGIQRGRLMALYERFRPAIILAEENSVGSVNIEALQAEGLPVRPFVTSAKSKGPLIEHLALAMEREDVALLDDDVLKHELMAYAMHSMRYGWAYSAPGGGHDDTVMATALSLWAARRHGGVVMDFV